MNKEEFEREALRIADERNLLIGTSLIAYIHVLRDLILKDLAENNPPVAWRYSTSNGNFRYRGFVPNFDKDYPTLKPAALYAKPPIQQAPEGWISDPDTIPASLIQATRDAICKEFGNNGTDGYYKRILAKVVAAMLSAAPEYKEDK